MSIVPEADFDMGLNLANVRAAVGHDWVPVQPDAIRTACTVMYDSNGAPDHIEYKEWISEAIMRRAMNLSLQVRVTSLPR